MTQKQRKVYTAKRSSKRPLVQALATLAMNANLKGFVTGTIWQGKSKTACVPVLNCYSCPGAVGSCPVGSLQAVLADRKHDISFYVLGFLVLVGMAVGRLFCGWACPFGWFQDLLSRIRLKKWHMPPFWNKLLGYGKYVMLVVFVVLLPLLVKNAVGIGDPWFCKYICPQGTLQAGIPLLLTNPPLQKAIGVLFNWKMLLLGLTIFVSMKVNRPFCRYVCPLGAFYGLFHKISLYQMQCDPNVCTNCGLCHKACTIGLTPNVSPNNAECIRCGDCIRACPHGALSGGFGPNVTPKSSSLQDGDRSY